MWYQSSRLWTAVSGIVLILAVQYAGLPADKANEISGMITIIIGVLLGSFTVRSAGSK